MTENLLTNEIPDKFKDPETGDLKADILLRSYKELEKKLSQAPSAPKTPEEYCIDCSHGLFEPDADVNRRMMKTDEPGLKRGGGNVGAADEKDLHAMMRDPRYWREKDPAFVSKVTDGFKKMYGNQ